MKRSLCSLTLIALVCSAALAEGFDFAAKGVAYNLAILPPLPVITGADIQMGLTVARPGDLPLDAVLRLRGGYEDLRLVRDELTGDPNEAPSSLGKYYYMSPNFQWAAGLVQAILPKEGGNLLEAFLFYRGRYGIFGQDLSTAVFSDARSYFGSSLLAGLAYNQVVRDSRRVKSGIGAEISAEAGPGFLNAQTDFWRLSAQGEFYSPLVSIGRQDSAKLNLFSVYLAGYLAADYAGGKDVPIWVMQSFGGRNIRKSLGSRIRGFPSMSYDSSLKVAANGEIRILGPALFGIEWCMPTVYIFCDTGYYEGFAHSATKSGARGSISSAGLGLNIDILDFAFLGVYGGLKFPGNDSLYATYGETNQAFWKLGFFLHF